MKAEKKKLAFGGLLAIYITVMLTVILAALAFWWHYLSCYEANRIEGVMDAYMTETLPEQLQKEIETYSISAQAGYQSAEEITAILAEKLGGDNWYYRVNRTKTASDRTVYNLYSGEYIVGEAVLYRVEPKPEDLGFASWMAPEVTLDLAQFGHTVMVTAPYGCRVSINGVPVGDSEVTETIGLYPQLADYETLITEPNQLLVYTIDNTYVDVAVEFSEGYSMVKDEHADNFYALPICEDAMAEELIEYCKSFVRAHTDYTYNKVALWAVQNHIVPDSALYQELTASSSGIKWGHGIHAKIQTLDIKNFTYYGNVITCEASYSMKTDEGDRSETMKILLVNSILGWRVIHREIL
ncbi:MAG: hypothetical protein IJD81_08135 [Oscillospiraceae bacterium]|nr:hypothetical protein [Oscillospiraceae bacterium]